MKFIRALLLEGKVPHLRTIKLIALVLSFLPIPIFFLTKIGPKDFGDLGWNFLIVIMLIRPLADVLPGIMILRTLVLFRKELGITSAWLILLHCYGAFAKNGTSIFTAIFQSRYWHLSHPLMWGILGILAVALLLITSNNFSIRLLRANWKRIQRLSYPLFLFTAIHIALISGEITVKAFLPVLAVLVFWTLAKFKIRIPFFIRNAKNEHQ